MPLDATANFVRGETDSSTDSIQTTVSVVDAGIFPDPATEGEYNVVIWDVADYPRPDQDPDVEILRVTAIDTANDDLSVTRGQEGTSGASHPLGSAVHLSPTAKMFSDIESAFNEFYDDSTQELTADVNNDSVSTEVLANAEIVTPDNTVADINAKLSTQNASVYIGPGNYELQDRIEITASDISVVIDGGAKISFATDASITKIQNKQGIDKSPIIYASQQTGLQIRSFGEINASDDLSNVDNGIPFYIEDAHDSEFHFSLVRNFQDGGWIVDSDSWTLDYLYGEDGANSAIALEGCRDWTVETVSAKDTGEVIDLNGYNEYWTIGKVIGDNTSDEMLDVNESPNGTCHEVRAYNKPEHFLRIFGTENGTRFTDRTAPNNCNNVTVKGLHGTTESRCALLEGTGDVKNFTLQADRAISDGNFAVYQDKSSDGQWDNLTIKGSYGVINASIDVITIGRPQDSNEKQASNLKLDVTCLSGGIGAHIYNYDNATGVVRAEGLDGGALVLEAVDGDTADDADLTVHATDCARAVVTAGSSSSTGCTFRGVGKNSTQSEDVLIGSVSTDTKISMDYGSITDNGTNTRGDDYPARTWDTVTASRSLNTIYQNTTLYDIEVSVTLSATSDNTLVGANFADGVNETDIIDAVYDQGERITIDTTVPAGASYSVNTFGDTGSFELDKWAEYSV